MAYRHRISTIRATPQDYKRCSVCGNINWYERDYCVICNSQSFEDVSEERLNEMLNTFLADTRDEITENHRRPV